MSSSTIVLITGANSGIGFAISQVLVQSSSKYHVIIAGRTLEKASGAQSAIDSAGGVQGSLSTVQIDVTDEESITRAATLVEQTYGRIDALINNAGVGGQSDSVKERYEKCLATNVLGPALVAEAFRPLLLKSSNPYSLFVGTGQRSLMRNALEKPAAFARFARVDAYQVSKAGMNMLALLELRDFGNQGLKVFVVSPGFLRSNIRGPSEEQISGWGGAGDPRQAGELVLEILDGKRDAQNGGFVHKDGMYDW